MHNCFVVAESQIDYYQLFTVPQLNWNCSLSQSDPYSELSSLSNLRYHSLVCDGVI